MHEDVARLEAAGGKSVVHFFEGKTLDDLVEALTNAAPNARLLTRTGMKKNGEACMWLQVKDLSAKESGGDVLLNASHQCPPEPQEMCDD
jgi:hypothetical protein